MANPKIVVDALLNDDQFLREANKIQIQMDRLDTLSQKTNLSKGALTQALKNEANAMKASTMSVTDFRSAYGIALDVVRVGQSIWQNTAEETLKYDSAVRQLAEVSGVGAEESSRLLQVMDDFKLTAADVNMATKALTKEGLSPTLETLAQLSDEYRAIQDPQDKAAFLMDKFGKSGLKFAEAMSKGGEALRQMGTEVEKSLIRTDAQIAKTRLAELAFDKWADKVQALKIEIGSGLIGVVDGSTEAIADNAQAIFLQNEGYTFNTNMMGRYTDAQREAWEEANKLATEQYLLANGIDITTEAIDGEVVSMEELEAQALAAADALKDMNDRNRTLLGAIDDIQSAEENYTETKAELAAERLEIASWDIAALDENSRKQAENQKAFEDANLAILDGLVERKLMQDGVMDDDEVAWLINKREEWGIYSAEQAEHARSVMKEVDDMTNAIANIPTEKTFTLTVATNGEIPFFGVGTPPISNNSAGKRQVGHASGGNFEIPMSYGVEGFRMGGGDTASGGETVSITPKGGATNDDVISAIKQTKIDEKSLGRIVGREVAMAIMGAG